MHSSPEFARTHHRLLTATCDCVAATGFQTSTARVAAAAGCSPGTLFRHFPTREHLLEAALQQAFNELTELLPQALPQDTIYEAIRRRWEAAGRRAVEFPNAFRYCVLYRATPGLPQPKTQLAYLRQLGFGGVDHVLATALGSTARGAWAARLLVESWVSTVAGIVTPISRVWEEPTGILPAETGTEAEAKTEAEVGADPTMATLLEWGLAAWWAAIGLSRDTLATTLSAR